LEIIAAMYAAEFLSASSPRYTPPRGRERRRALTGLAELANYDLALRRQESISLTTTAELVGMELSAPPDPSDRHAKKSH
jgi:hypothetical protein